MSTYSSGAVFIPLDQVESKELMDIIQHLITMGDYLGGYEDEDDYSSPPQAELDEIAKRKEAEFSKTYPELADWAQALLQNFENECFSMMEATSGPYGVEFSSSENFKEEFVARIVQLAIGRYELAPITFFAAYNGLAEDFNSNYGHIYKVSAEKIEVISTIDLIQAHKDRLKETDLLACMNDSSRDFKAFYRSKDWGEAGKGSLKRAALKLAARNDQKENFRFLFEEGVPADDPGLLRLLESRPEMKAMVEARKISEEVMEGGAAKTRKTSISRMSAV